MTPVAPSTSTCWPGRIWARCSNDNHTDRAGLGTAAASTGSMPSGISMAAAGLMSVFSAIIPYGGRALA